MLRNGKSNRAFLQIHLLIVITIWSCGFLVQKRKHLWDAQEPTCASEYYNQALDSQVGVTALDYAWLNIVKMVFISLCILSDFSIQGIGNDQ